MKIIIVIFLLIIIYNLVSSLYYLTKDDKKSLRTVKALTWRIGLSLTLFILLLLGFWLGIIEPHAVSNY